MEKYSGCQDKEVKKSWRCKRMGREDKRQNLNKSKNIREGAEIRGDDNNTRQEALRKTQDRERCIVHSRINETESNRGRGGRSSASQGVGQRV